jgi:ATP-dependent Lon protease
MLPREYFHHSPPPRDESQFCNFAAYVPAHCAVEFDKAAPHHAPSPHRAKVVSCSRQCETLAPRLQLDSEKLGRAKEKIVFNDAVLRAVADYKKYDKERPERPAEQTRDRDWQRIRQGEELTRKTCSTAMGEFYHGVHKWTTPQMDMRLRRQNEDYQRGENRLAEARVEWSITKRREDMIEQRKKEILGRKRIKDVKGEICDEKYFLRNQIEV